MPMSSQWNAGAGATSRPGTQRAHTLQGVSAFAGWKQMGMQPWKLGVDTTKS